VINIQMIIIYSLIQGTIQSTSQETQRSEQFMNNKIWKHNWHIFDSRFTVNTAWPRVIYVWHSGLFREPDVIYICDIVDYLYMYTSWLPIICSSIVVDYLYYQLLLIIHVLYVYK